jgi:hypothetical protein
MIAFLFSDEPSGSIESSFLETLSNTPQAVGLRSRSYSGALLFRTFAEYISGAARDADGLHEWLTLDRDTYKPIALDLAEAIVGQRHTTDTDTLPMAFFRSRVWCYALGTCPIELADVLDVRLRVRLPNFLGYVDVDLANPVQYELFVNLLMDGKQLDASTIYEAWPEVMDLDQHLAPFRRTAVLSAEFEKIADPCLSFFRQRLSLGWTSDLIDFRGICAKLNCEKDFLVDAFDSRSLRFGIENVVQDVTARNG